ncbi:hypothetical protein BCR44DRAFT_1431464 [Catenaria anguillulae PL171]|uniref:Uncharacterized protein n=1 Tax=Catenaria anguillulae PL171 TaxID=765915 RepID=A0A1Y2HRE8_9FUNG|nr:hypothetical protein BCR44DRAFT_1431464 [Catenaria anguillulae PL171]
MPCAYQVGHYLRGFWASVGQLARFNPPSRWWLLRREETGQGSRVWTDVGFAPRFAQTFNREGEKKQPESLARRIGCSLLSYVLDSTRIWTCFFFLGWVVVDWGIPSAHCARDTASQLCACSWLETTRARQ